MPNIKTLKQAGAQSATWIITDPTAPGVEFNASDWTQLPDGKLKQLLVGPYLSETNPSPLYATLAEAGVSATTIGTFGASAYGATDVVFGVAAPTGQQGPMSAYVFYSSSDFGEACAILTLSVAYSVEA